MRDSTIIYRSFYEAIKELPIPNQAEVWGAIFEFSLNFKQVKLTGISATIFTLIKPQLEANLKRYQSGLSPKQKQKLSKAEAKTKRKRSENEANVNENVNHNDNPNENVNPNLNENGNGNPAYAEVVIYPSFDDFWNAYEKKVDRAKCEKKWGRLSKKEKEAALEYLPAYKSATPDIKFRRNPETFINNKTWENEIIKQNGHSKLRNPDGTVNWPEVNKSADEFLAKQGLG